MPACTVYEHCPPPVVGGDGVLPPVSEGPLPPVIRPRTPEGAPPIGEPQVPVGGAPPVHELPRPGDGTSTTVVTVPTGPVPQGGGGDGSPLPVTGFDAAVLLFAGLAALGVGTALRRSSQ